MRIPTTRIPKDELEALHAEMNRLLNERNALAARLAENVFVRVPMSRWEQLQKFAADQERQRKEMDEWAAKQVGKAEARVGRLEEALRGTGWRDLDGLCWCEKSTELTGKPHRPQCLAARRALDGETDDVRND